MDQKGLLTELRKLTFAWAEQAARGQTIEAVIVEVNGSLARIQRTGESYADVPFYPTISPYFPIVGDRVRCLKEEGGGYVILGAINRSTDGSDHNLNRYAPLRSPAFDGSPTAPTAAPGDYSDKLATTAHVKDVLGSGPAIDSPAIDSPTIQSGTLNSPTINSATVTDPQLVGTVVTETVSNPSDYSNRVAHTSWVADRISSFLSNSPALGGTPTAPTQTASNNSTAIATTAFVKAQNYAPLASPAFTGTPTAPTPSTGDNSTRISTTAWVRNFAATVVRASQIASGATVRYGTTSIASGTGQNVDISFGITFASPPFVVACMGPTNFSTATRPTMCVISTTTTTVKVAVATDNSSNNTYTIHWIAIGQV